MKKMRLFICLLGVLPLIVSSQSLIRVDSSGIPIGVKAVNRIGYDPINSQHLDYYIFSSNAITDAQKEKKLIVENAYEVNAYGNVPKRSNFDSSIVLLGVDFNDKFFEVTLEDTLVKDSIYFLSFKYFLGQSSKQYLNNLGVSFLKSSSISCGSFGRIYQESGVESQPSFCKVKIVSPENNRNWVPINIKYKANGGERFLILGRNTFKSKKNHLMSLKYLDKYLNRDNIIRRYNRSYKKSIFYFFKDFNLEGLEKGKKIDNITTAKYDLGGYNSYTNSEFNKINKFCVDQEYELEGLYFKDSLLNVEKSISALNDIRFSILYEFNSSVIEIIYKTTSLDKMKSEIRLQSMERFFIENYDISPSRIQYKIKTSKDYTVKDTRLYIRFKHF